MPNAMATKDAWLTEQRRSNTSSEVTYIVGATGTQVLASIGRTDFEVTDASGMLQRFESRDFIVKREDMPTEPARGHRIQESDSYRTYLYEVMAPVQSDPPWRWADASRTAYRIHTKLISASPAEAPPPVPI